MEADSLQMFNTFGQVSVKAQCCDQLQEIAVCTLMEGPEEKEEEEILNGVALKPRVNSEIDGENWH